MRLTGKEIPGEWPLDGEHKCAVCGEEPDAMWRGAVALCICKTCARKILPVLIADALTPDDATYGKILGNFDALKLPYVTAALCRVTKKRRA